MASFIGPLETVAACAGTGAFIDFWIGRAGQERVKKQLEDWWLRLSYVRWGNFGREEATFALEVFEKGFGKKLFSWQRVIACYIASLLAFLYTWLTYYVVTHKTSLPLDEISAMKMLFSIILFALGASITQGVARLLIRIVGNNSYANIIGFAFIAFFTFAMLAIWPILFALACEGVAAFLEGFFLIDDAFLIEHATTDIYSQTPAYLIKTSAFAIIDLAYNTAVHPFSSLQTNGHSLLGEEHLIFTLFFGMMLSTVLNLLRFAITIIFVCSFFLQPLKQLLLAFWARIIESDKPVFTLVFGGVAAIAKTVEELVKNVF